jgi:hypothetical protein
MDGPVVKAAQHALASGSVVHALVWVKPAAEQEIREAFEKTMAVRKLGRDAQEMADRWFFETLVRVHRQGEGEPFTGLKPAGYYQDPAYAAAEKALETATLAPVSKIPEHVAHKLHELHEAALAAKDFEPSDLAAGRIYVQRYSAFMHYVESLSHLVHEADNTHAGATSAPTHAPTSVRDHR